MGAGASAAPCSGLGVHVCVCACACACACAGLLGLCIAAVVPCLRVRLQLDAWIQPTPPLQLTHGSNKQGKHTSHTSSLQLAARAGPVQIITLLLSWEAPRDAENHALWTPMHCAAYNGHTDSVIALIEVSGQARGRVGGRSSRAAPIGVCWQGGVGRGAAANLYGGQQLLRAPLLCCLLLALLLLCTESSGGSSSGSSSGSSMQVQQ